MPPSKSDADLPSRIAALERELGELRLHEARWRTLMDRSPFGVAIYRPDGSVLGVNDTAKRIFELTDEEDELASSVYNILEDPQLVAKGLGDHVRRAFAGETVLFPCIVYEIETPIRRRKVRRWLEGALCPTLDDEGNVREVLSIQVDLTALVEARGNLRESEDRFREIANNIRGVFWLFNWIDDCITYVSPAFEEIWGLPCEQLLADSRTWTDSLHPEDREVVEQSLIRMRETGESESWEYRIVRPDGEVRWIYDRAFPIRDESGRVVRVAGISEDITARKRDEEERRRFDEKVRQAQKLESLGVLAGGIAHDFNNLLTAMLGNAELALQELPPNAPSREYVERVHTAARRASDLTNQMLAYSGRGRFVIEPVDVSRLAEEMGELLRAAVSKRAELQFEFADGLPAVDADAAQARQVVMNLITNASDAIGEGAGSIRVRTGTLDADWTYLHGCIMGEHLQPGPYVYLEVSDDGCGMDEETLARIFDPFFSTKFTGRGLGLAAVLGIVRGHGATLCVDSAVGCGSTFTVLFPPTDSRVEARSEPLKERRLPAEGATVLLVDDEAMVREVSSAMLECQGFRVLTAEDGYVGVETYRKHSDEISLVLLDLTMPRLAGEEALRKLREIREDVCVVLSSGYNEQDATERFAGTGLSGFVQKPYTSAVLMNAIRKALGGS